MKKWFESFLAACGILVCSVAAMGLCIFLLIAPFLFGAWGCLSYLVILLITLTIWVHDEN